MQKLPYNKLFAILLFCLIFIFSSFNINKKKRKAYKKSNIKSTTYTPLETNTKSALASRFISEADSIEKYDQTIINKPLAHRTPEMLINDAKQSIHLYSQLKYNVYLTDHAADSINKLPYYDISLEELGTLHEERKNKYKEIDSIYFNRYNVKPSSAYTDSVFRAWKYPKLKR